MTLLYNTEKTSIRMNTLIDKLFFPGLSRLERRQRIQMVMVVSAAVLAVGVIVAMEVHHLRHLPIRPPSLFD
jgi:hypothetical protein